MKFSVRESDRSQTVGPTPLGCCDWQGSILSDEFSPLANVLAAKKSGCENRTRVSASTRLKDDHYPNPDTLSTSSYTVIA